MLPELLKKENQVYAYKEKWKERVFIVLNGNIFLAFAFYFGRKKGGTSCEDSNISKVLH